MYTCSLNLSTCWPLHAKPFDLQLILHCSKFSFLGSGVLQFGRKVRDAGFRFRVSIPACRCSEDMPLRPVLGGIVGCEMVDGLSMILSSRVLTRLRL